MALPQSLEPISNAIHLSIDMQNLFAPGGIWATPWMEWLLPAIVTVAEINPQRTVFTRFVTPLHAEDRLRLSWNFSRRHSFVLRSCLTGQPLDRLDGSARAAPG